LTDLIYDMGMHHGEDSEFYLRKGFRVVAVEADPEICRSAAGKLRPFVEGGQLTIVNRAIADRAGPVTFYRSARSDWGTIVGAWDRDNAARGVASEEIIVEAITLADLVREYGDAFYMKIDIEGMDRVALESLGETPIRPLYLSMETSFARNPSMEAVRGDFDLLASLGYDRFKIIDQQRVPLQTAPNPPLVGDYVPVPASDGSGLFGEDRLGRG
jgi:FkbM family methyltransferase